MKAGFDLRFTPTEYVIPRETLILVLRREDELRFSPEYQARYSESERLEHIRDVTVELQKQALREHGLDEEHGLVVLQNARFEFKVSVGWLGCFRVQFRARTAGHASQDDPEMDKLTVYFRLDTCRRGCLAQVSGGWWLGLGGRPAVRWRCGRRARAGELITPAALPIPGCRRPRGGAAHLGW